MSNINRFSDSGWLQQRYNQIYEIAETWRFHSRQTEVRSYDVLLYSPDEILDFVRPRVQVIWKRGKEVGVLIPPSILRERYLVLMDTKLENSSVEVCRAIFALKTAEAFLLERPSDSKDRRELVESCGIDLSVLVGEHAHGFVY